MFNTPEQQQQQQPDPWLLEGLPAPALRRVLHLASTPGSPALCRLACVSIAVKAAAVAAKEPVQLSIQDRDDLTFQLYGNPTATAAAAARLACTKAWLRRHVVLVQGLRVECRGDDFVLEGSLLGALVPGAPVAAAAPAAAGEVHQATAAAVVAPGQGSGETGSNATLEFLDIWMQGLCPHAIRATINFPELQVLVLRTWYWRYTSLEAAVVNQQLFEALPQLSRLKKFALLLRRASPHLGADNLLQQLPSCLEALDLGLGDDVSGAGSTCSSSSLAHLGHLTSLRLRGMAVVSGATSGQADPQGQQQGPTAACGGVAGGQVQQQLAMLRLAEEQQQQQQPVRRACVITAMSVHPGMSTTWFAAPSLETLELILGDGPHPDLGQLSRCPHLRQMCLLYKGRLPPHTGVSAVTQLTHLRLDASNVAKNSSSSGLGAELAALGQLRVLEVSYAILKAAPHQVWQPVVGHVTQLVVLVRREECSDLQALSDLVHPVQEAPTTTTTSTTTTSSSSSNAPNTPISPGIQSVNVLPDSSILGSSTSHSSSPSGQAAVPTIPYSSSGTTTTSGSSGRTPITTSSSCDGPVVRPGLRYVQLMLHGHKNTSYWGEFCATVAARMLQWEAELPGLRVTCERDSYNEPCWKAYRRASHT